MRQSRMKENRSGADGSVDGPQNDREGKRRGERIRNGVVGKSSEGEMTRCRRPGSPQEGRAAEIVLVMPSMRSKSTSHGRCPGGTTTHGDGRPPPRQGGHHASILHLEEDEPRPARPGMAPRARRTTAIGHGRCDSKTVLVKYATPRDADKVEEAEVQGLAVEEHLWKVWLAVKLLHGCCVPGASPGSIVAWRLPTVKGTIVLCISHLRR